MKTLVIDCTACRVLPRWHDKTPLRIIPIKQGEHYKDFDIRHELLTDETNAVIRAAGIEMLKERLPFPVPEKAAELPVGFNADEIPEGAVMYMAIFDKEPV